MTRAVETALSSAPAQRARRAAQSAALTDLEQPYEHLQSLLVAYASLPIDDLRRVPLRERLVTGFLPVARNVAARYRDRGEPFDDLFQVACLGLVNAIDPVPA